MRSNVDLPHPLGPDDRHELPRRDLQVQRAIASTVVAPAVGVRESVDRERRTADHFATNSFVYAVSTPTGPSSAPASTRNVSKSLQVVCSCRPNCSPFVVNLGA